MDDSPAKTINQQPDVMAALASVFQEHGFGGATLTLFTKATGLKRPSLYHRFPGGKLEMALAVLNHARHQLLQEVLAPLKETGDPLRRIKQAAKNMKQYYDDGEGACLMDAISIGAKGEDREAIDKAVGELFNEFINSFVEISREMGVNPTEAKQRSEDAVVRLEGSLVVARGTGRTTAFKRTLKQLPGLLSGEPTP